MTQKIRVALFDQNGFMTSFVNYLCRKKQTMLETRLFTDLSLLKENLKKGRIDVLLAEEEAWEDLVSIRDFVSQIILLSEGNTLCENSENSLYQVIFKYQAMEDIVHEVIALVAENDAIGYSLPIASKKAAEVIGGFAPFGGGGVSEYLLQLAKEFCEKEKILYISLEEFHSLSYLQKNEDKSTYTGMSEVIFYLKQKKGKLALKLDSVITRIAGMDYIFAVENYQDLKQFFPEEMEEFLQILQSQTDYQKILFDIGFLSDTTLYLMEQCDWLYMPSPTTPSQQSKVQSFLASLHRERREQLYEKFLVQEA